MVLTFSLFFVYHSPYPFYFGFILLVLGMACLWVTRYTFKFFPVWGRFYYLFSSIIRPCGILLISWAWMEILAVHSLPVLAWAGTLNRVFFFLAVLGMMCDHFLRKMVVGLAVCGVLYVGYQPYMFPANNNTTILLTVPLFLFFCAFAWMVLSIINLGLRRSFLYADVNDPLIDNYLYRYHRHPQLLASLLLVFSSLYLFHPGGILTDTILLFRYIHFWIMTLGIVCVILFEDRDLAKRFGRRFEDYKESRPGIGVTLRTPESKKEVWGITGGLLFILFILFIFQHQGIDPDYENYGDHLFVAPEPRSTWSAGRRWNFLRYIKKFLISYQADIGELPPYQLSPETVENFKQELQKGFTFEPYPLTLFFCREHYDVTATKTAPGAHRVDTLPFPLLCQDKYIEFALAYDFDGDGFPQTYFWAVRLPPNNFGRFPDIGFYIATDDNENKFRDDFQDRVAGDIRPKIREIEKQSTDNEHVWIME